MSVLLPIEKENKRKWDTLVSTKVHLPSHYQIINSIYEVLQKREKKSWELGKSSKEEKQSFDEQKRSSKKVWPIMFKVLGIKREANILG